MKYLSVIVPVKNEEGSIKSLVERTHITLSSAKIIYEIIFVDDHSTDKTVSIIKSLQKKYPVRLHTKIGRGGKAYSMLEGSRIAKHALIAMIDGDLQYPPEALAPMAKLTDKYGVVVANRIYKSGSKLRKLGTSVSYYLFEKFLHGFDCDTQSGLKIFKKKIISHLSEDEVTPWTLDMPLLKTAQDLGESIGSYDIEFLKRETDASKVNFVKAGLEIATASVKLKLKKRKVYTTPSLVEGNSTGAGYVFKGKEYITHTRLPHEMTALDTFYPWQKVFLSLLAASFILGIIINAHITLLILIALLTLLYFGDFVFSLYVLQKSLRKTQELTFTDEEIEAINDADLPVYTILCPLYKEERILPHFVDAMKSLDWPKKKLEVMLLLEEDDKDTINAAKKLNLPKYFKVLVVPHSFPKTKPKACNYGFNHSTGEFVVIYDAEDKPDPLQLKKAYLGFMKTSEKTVCLQSKLNYFNTDHNLLTKLFTAEYSLWFDLMLPGLQSVRGPLPLGGTSNHFRSKVLKELHAWDPFNVTEDCDLGVRIFKEKYQTAIIDSTTFEEANSSYRSWLKQRSRWIKGYLQTYLVHIRNPFQFIRSHGIDAFMFHLVIGMRMMFVLINPLFWSITIAYFAFFNYVGPSIESLYPTPIFYPAVVLLIFANFVHFYNYMIGCMKKDKYEVIKYVFFIPMYWIMTSWAAMIAFYQLFTKPHYWEKTTHGLHLIDGKINKFSLKSFLPKNISIKRPLVTSAAVSGVVLIAAMIVANVINFGYSTYLGRTLTLEEFGNISFFGSVLSFSAIVIYAVGKSVTYETAKYKGKYSETNRYIWRNVYSKSYYVFAGIAIIWILLSGTMARFFQFDNYLPFILYSPAWIFFALSTINAGFITGNWKFKQVAVITLLESIAKLAASVVLVETGNSQYVYVALPIALSVSFIVSDRVVRKSKAVDTKVEKVFPKKFFATSVLTNISVLAFISLDVILAKRLLLPQEAGQYALVSLIGKTIYLLGSLFTQFVTPVISKEVGESKNSKATFYKIIGATLLVSLSAYVAVGLLAQYTVPLLFGESANNIVEYLPMFGLSMVAFTISSATINYHQIKNEYIFPVVGFVFSFVQIIVVGALGTTLSRFISAITVVVMIQGFIIMLLHLLETPHESLQNNLNDLYDLLFGKQQTVKKEKKKLKILVLNWRDTKHVWAGGAEVYIHQIAKRWANEGHTVTLFCGNDGKSPRNEKIDGVQMVRRGGFYTVYMWAFLYYVLRFRGKYDVLVDCENGIPFFSPLYARIPKVLLIYHVHQDVLKQHLRFPFSYFAMFLEGKVMPFVYKNSEVATISDSSRKDIIKLGFSEKNNLQIIYPGIDLSSYRTSAKTKYPSFLYLGRLQHYKNVDVAINAFSKVAKNFPKAKFVIAGHGESYHDLKKLVSELNLTNEISFTGFFPESDKPKLLSESWISIQPSSWEGWGITVIEANASGTPVIASNVPGLVDSVIDGKTGILVKVHDVEQMSKAMEKLIKSEKLRKQLSREGLVWAKNFSWDKSANTFLSILYRQTNYDRSLVSNKNLALE